VVTCYIAGVDVERPLMKVIITFSFCCDNLRKSKFMTVEKPRKLGIFFFYFVATLSEDIPRFIPLLSFVVLATLSILGITNLGMAWQCF